MDALSERNRSEYVHKLLNKQITNIFTTIKNSYDYINDNGHKISSNSDSIHSKANTINKMLLEQLGYYMYEDKSKVNSDGTAGNGLFIRTNTDIYPGTVLALFPGLVYLPEHIQQPEVLEKLLPDDDYYLMTRHDNCLIDSRKLLPIDDEYYGNPYAIAHKANHCGAGVKPNSMQV